MSHVTSPHVHVSCASTVSLPRSRTEQQRIIDIGGLHLPTGRVFLEDVVELLIREFDIQLLRDDWQEVLRANDAAIQRGRRW